MAAIFIESDNTKSLKLLAELAEELGVSVNKLSKPETENIHLSMLLKKEKNIEKVNRKVTEKNTPVPKKGSHTFSGLRKRIKSKMTIGQIDEQIKSLRAEWQRDI